MLKKFSIIVFILISTTGDGEFPKKFYDYFLDYCQITAEHFEDIVDSWRPDHLWNHDGSKWVLASKVN